MGRLFGGSVYVYWIFRMQHKTLMYLYENLNFDKSLNFINFVLMYTLAMSNMKIP